MPRKTDELIKSIVSEMGTLIDARLDTFGVLMRGQITSEIAKAKKELKEEIKIEIKASEERTKKELREEIKASEERTKKELREEIKASEERIKTEINDNRIKHLEERIAKLEQKKQLSTQ